MDGGIGSGHILKAGVPRYSHVLIADAKLGAVWDRAGFPVGLKLGVIAIGKSDHLDGAGGGLMPDGEEERLETLGVVVLPIDGLVVRGVDSERPELAISPGRPGVR